MRIALTGHRPTKLVGDYNMESPLADRIRKALEDVVDDLKPTQLITGMALGADTLWAELAIKKEIPFIAAIPCKNQDKMWRFVSRLKYNEILKHPLCTIHLVYDGEYNNKCMQQRNIWMVDNCDLLIAVWDGSPGGTANCHEYAIEVGKSILRINPKLI